ncbi:MAG: hypothetical protein HQ504_08025 [Rhodospirillaceae bacterium]|nr:hypothetical protein [Rhodospirillaceae bacterium]
MIYCFDIDGTICSNTEGDYEAAEPFKDVVEWVNALFEDGHRILLNTARGGTTGIDWTKVTERQLKEWGVRYHELIMGKPTADVFIDDRAINADSWRTSGGRLTLEQAKSR